MLHATTGWVSFVLLCRRRFWLQFVTSCQFFLNCPEPFQNWYIYGTFCPSRKEERLAAAAAPRALARPAARGARNNARASLKAEAAAIAAAAFAEGGAPNLAGLAPAALEDLRRLQACPRHRPSGSSNVKDVMIPKRYWDLRFLWACPGL